MRQIRFIVTLARRSLRAYLDDNCSQMAAAISYYVLFSLFPLLIFAVGVLGLLLQNSQLQRDLIDGVLELIPFSDDEGRDEVTEAVRGVTGVGSGALGIFGLLGMAWGGSSMFGVVRRALNVAFNVAYDRPFVQRKLLDLAMVMGLAVFLLASVAATAFLRAVRRFSGDVAYLGDLAESAGFVWDAGSVLIPFLLSFLAFLLLYWVVPAARTRPREVWPGALLAAVLFEAGKLGFAVYLENFGRYDVVFGSLGAAATFLFWVYISANVLLLGAEVASEHRRLLLGEPAAPEEGEKAPLRQALVRALRSLFVQERRGPDGPGR